MNSLGIECGDSRNQNSNRLIQAKKVAGKKGVLWHNPHCHAKAAVIESCGSITVIVAIHQNPEIPKFWDGQNSHIADGS